MLNKILAGCRAVFFTAIFLIPFSARAEVMMQWFETDWDEIYRRLPEVAAVGYDFLWLPPPSKPPTAQGTKWGNVGYSLYDRFDLGDIPQRGSLASRYGTRGSLRNMVDQSHQCDVKIMPDIIMNHNGNGPDFRYYPGMKTEDFHLQFQNGYLNTLNYKRGPTMNQWCPGDGYGGTMWQDLANLIDIRTEPDNRFTGGSNTPGWNFVSGTSFLRHVGQYDKYPYFNVNTNTYGNENAAQMLFRWIAWLGNAMDFDGLRLDAVKHVPWEFFGTKGSGFLHEAQYNFNQRRGFVDSDLNEADTLFENYVRRDDLLIFAEILSPIIDTRNNNECNGQGLNYWFGSNMTNVNENPRNPMRFIDYPLKQQLYSAFGNSPNDNLAALSLGGGGLDPQLGIMYAWGHDEGPPTKTRLAYAFILTHVGYPMVYFTGKNIEWDDYGRDAAHKTWMIPGFDEQALGDDVNDIPNLVYINQNFARGREWERWADGNMLAYERYDDLNGNKTPDNGEGLLLVVLNDSGGSSFRLLQTTFDPGTTLHDYTGHAGDVVVNGSRQAGITVPGGTGGEGWVCYAPRNADGVANAIQITQGGPAPTMTWITPHGVHGTSKTQQLTRVTATNIDLNVFFNPVGGAVDAVMMKWGQGKKLTATNYFDNGSSLVTGGFEKMNQTNTTNWNMNVSINSTNIPEGLNVLKARVFNQRTAGYPALYQTLTKVVYVDRRGPDVNVIYPAEGQTVNGDCVMVVSNMDFTAYGMTVSVDGNAPVTAYEIMKGLWKLNLTDLSSGGHTVTVTTTEADWASPRAVINTSIYTRAFNVVSNANPISLNIANGVTQQLPFFKTSVAAAGSPSSVKLYWDGYELPFNAGDLTNVFNGEIVYRDNVGNVVSDRLWGAFCNGQHFFEAARVDGGVTSRVARRMVFNLYGINAIDSDGDSLPDNLEMPFIDTLGKPGGDQPWPGDDNRNFVPDPGETWQNLNPYNHSTFFKAQWDDGADWDGDGFSNGEEMMAGYNEGNIYKYSIYVFTNKPSGAPTNNPALVTWTPQNPTRCPSNTLAITYKPNNGPLSNASPIWIGIGYNNFSNVQHFQMSDIGGGQWQQSFGIPTNATVVDFYFHNALTNVFDNNSAADWHVSVGACVITTNFFTMDGLYDNTNYEIAVSGPVRILAAVRENNLYFATPSAAGQTNDHFLLVTDKFAPLSASLWGKAGQIYFDKSTKPYLAGESGSGFKAINNGGTGGRVAMGSGVNALEGELNLEEVFGTVPDVLYMAAAYFGTDDGNGMSNQCPGTWDANNDLEITEFVPVPVSSIRIDSATNGFIRGRPLMWTVVNGSSNNANYDVRRFFINELYGDSQSITVVLQPNPPGGTNVLSDVELFSNLNRRDFAALEEDPATVTPGSQTTYFRAYPMTNIGGGRYSYTLPVNKCGAYRINARYKINGQTYYYTDNGLRRDCAVVVSPKKALNLSMYEVNPLNAEATSPSYDGRSTFKDLYLANTNKPDIYNTAHFTSLGVNMVWLQPIHPVQQDLTHREKIPGTSTPYEPGSPYAVRNYWKVNPILGEPATEENAMTEFTNFVQALDNAGVGVMLDGTFNHSAWDCEIGQVAVNMFPSWASNETDMIRAARPSWYSKLGNYGLPASYYASEVLTDVAGGPDRFDFGKWTDVADFFFGNYDALVAGQTAEWKDQFKSERDYFAGFGTNDAVRELWEYFAYYPIYWLEKTGHPVGTPKADSNKGIDGLRCDFAQGLPSQFWEYCINKTRSVKWDFIFMAESLDGFATVNGNPRHGIGFRSSRHFDVLNENIVFYWRNNFFGYNPNTNDCSTPTGNPTTQPTFDAFDTRRKAFDNSPLLLNLTSHDELYPNNSPSRVLYAYAQVAAMDGVPMLFYGQEAGAQNSKDAYGCRGGIPNSDHNFSAYELNFGKSIPQFKQYNAMTNIWVHRDWDMQNFYGRINNARKNSTALKSQNNYFLSKFAGGGYDANIFAVARFTQPGISAASQDVVFVFVNNNPAGNTNVSQVFNLNATINGANWFGITNTHLYNIVDLISTNPTHMIWQTNFPGSKLINEGIYVGLPFQGQHAHYLRLIDRTVNTNSLVPPDSDGDGIPNYEDPDDDNDGLPDWWEAQYGQRDPNGQDDDDGMKNYDEYLNGTDPTNGNSHLEMRSVAMNGDQVQLSCDAVMEKNYRLQKSTGPMGNESWQYLGALRTALSPIEFWTDPSAPDTNTFYRMELKP